MFVPNIPIKMASTLI